MYLHVELAYGNLVLVEVAALDEHWEHLVFTSFGIDPQVVEEVQPDHFCLEIDGVDVNHGGLLITIC